MLKKMLLNALLFIVIASAFELLIMREPFTLKWVAGKIFVGLVLGLVFAFMPGKPALEVFYEKVFRKKNAADDAR